MCLPCLLLVTLILALSACDNKTGKKTVTGNRAVSENKAETTTKPVSEIEGDSASSFVEAPPVIQHKEKKISSIKGSASSEQTTQTKKTIIVKQPVTQPASEVKQDKNETVVAASDNRVEVWENKPQKSVDKEIAAGECSTKERYIALKTNLAGWALGAVNIAAEVQINTHLSVELPVYYSPWKMSEKHALQQFTIQPEARYWFGQVGKGHFTGVHFMTSWYNMRWNKYRYQNARALFGVGLSYGYKLPLSEHFGAEFTLGAGYMHASYEKFFNIKNGLLIGSENKSIWGITRLGISLVYRF